jgi:hypothetical protein
MDELFASVEFMKVYALLIETARRCGLTTYREIAGVTGWKGQGSYFASRVGQLLFKINAAEHAQGRPMLSAVVLNQKPDKRTAASLAGFFECAKGLGLSSAQSKTAQHDFLNEQLHEVYTTWAEKPQ